MKKEMLINVLQPEECRIAIVEDGVLEELYVERASQESFVGNIYRGRIVNIEPSIQAAFVDFGIGRNGFLHVSDVDPAYYRHLEPARGERGGRDRDRDRDRGGRDRGDRGGRDRDRGGRGGPRGGGGGGRGRSFGGPRPPERTYRRLSDEELASEDAALEAAALEAAAAETLESASEALTEETVVAAPLVPEIIVPPPVEGSEEDDREFGAGLLDEDAPVEPGWSVTTAETTRVEVVTGSAADAGAEADSGMLAVPGAPARKRRSSPRKKKEEVAAEPAETPAEPAEPPVKKRRASRRKKEESAEGAGENEGGEGEGPKFMGSAERRTDPHDPGVTGPLEEPSEGANGFGAGIDLPEDASEEFEESENAEGLGETEDYDDYEEQDETADEADTDEEEPDNGLGDDFGLSGDDEYAEDEGDEEGGRGGRGGRRRGPGRDRRRGGGGGRDGGRPKPLIQDIFKRGQEVIVQVIKEPLGTKGPTLSTYISIAGRYLVLMPGLNRIGVSRKIADDEQRYRLRDILEELRPPKGLGFIIRTAGMDRDKKELQNDLAYLLRLWQVVVRRIKKLKGPCEVYKESDIITRTIRDTFTSDINTIWVDEPTAYQHAQEFLQIVMPRYAERIRHYADTEPLFHRYRIEEEINRIQQKRIDLPGGGSIIIEQTEALVAIDVNSGNFRADNNAEETAFQMNLIAAKEIARQLRLRDLGGVIVNDFIDMNGEDHRRRVEQAMRDAVKRDRARTKILKISQFGLIEMTRQRIRPSLRKSIFQDCPHCRATGQVKTTESMAIEVMRTLQLAAHREHVHRIHVRVHADVAAYILNKRRREIMRLEDTGELQVTVSGLFGVSPETLEVLATDHNGNEVKLLPGEQPNRYRDHNRGPQGRDRR